MNDPSSSMPRNTAVAEEINGMRPQGPSSDGSGRPGLSMSDEAVSFFTDLGEIFICRGIWISLLDDRLNNTECRYVPRATSHSQAFEDSYEVEGTVRGLLSVCITRRR